ncbi:type I-B CRISPR-associated protein Cas8b/Csh1 [uncultured Microscilla sp.]|uniref:type I-B CRISPR-associated protein Cas8b/Csh1 n=1 Tax=uncultured Microscilla sp. TaxID=432653 RepID=UPI00261BA012|nr:type I-B CRISPR-associated protein Cas8b/Csh1 [uncultured Microscilla sp.]
MQDRAIIEIGKLELAAMQKANKAPYQFFVQNMFPKKADYSMALMVFELHPVAPSGFRCTFKAADLTKVSEQNFEKFAYRKGSARGGDITFTTKFGDLDKKLKTLVNNQFKALMSRLTTSPHTKEFQMFNAVHQFLLKEENADKVKAALTKLYETLDKKEQQATGLSMVLELDGEKYYLSDFKAVQEVLYENGTQEKSKKYDVTSEGTQELCAGCLQSKPVVHGFGSPYKYATVDKPGMVSGFFKQKNNWKNYPICTDCSLVFELGRNYIAQHLSKSFYGKFYYVIPKIILQKDRSQLPKIIEKLEGLYKDLMKQGRQHEKREDAIWEMVAQDDDFFSLNLLFYEENSTTKAIKIKLLLEEIVPSQFRKLFVDTPKQINDHVLYKKAYTSTDKKTKQKKKKDLKFSFGLLKTFFEHDFYRLMQQVFEQQPMAEESLYASFMQAIRANYNKMKTSDGYAENTHLTVLKAHLALRYLAAIKVIDLPNKPIQTMEHTTPSEDVQTATSDEQQKKGFDPQRIEQFMQDNPQFLSNDAKRGVFLLGVLVRHVLDVQYSQLNGNTPFENKLKGYQLSPTHLQNLYTEAIGKLRQYKATPPTLLKVLNQYFVLHIDQILKMSNNEASFYFVAGTQMIRELKYVNTESKK